MSVCAIRLTTNIGLTICGVLGKPIGFNSKKQQPLLNLCKLSPGFCHPSPALPYFCAKFGRFCGTGHGAPHGVTSMSRIRMPQVAFSHETGFARFLAWLESDGMLKPGQPWPSANLTKARTITLNEKTVPLTRLIPSQAEINVIKTVRIGEKIVTQGYQVYRPLVIRDPDVNDVYWIVDGHHRWSAQRFAAELNSTVTSLPVRVIEGIDVTRLYELVTRLIDLDGHSLDPTVATFESMVEIRSRLRDGGRVHEHEIQHAWEQAAGNLLAHAGLTWQHENHASELWHRGGARHRVLDHFGVL